jgi:hypothetical protein
MPAGLCRAQQLVLHACSNGFIVPVRQLYRHGAMYAITCRRAIAF